MEITLDPRLGRPVASQAVEQDERPPGIFQYASVGDMPTP